MRSFILAGLILISILFILSFGGVALTENDNMTQNMTPPMSVPMSMPNNMFNNIANVCINLQNVTLNLVLIQNLTENRNTIVPAGINAVACDTTCTGGKQCANGACTCPTTKPDQCSGVCVNKSTDTSNCGACGTACTNNHGATQCKNGYCGPTCSIGYASCDGNNSNGCEANLLTDNKNCGACGTTCTGGKQCINGACTCPTTKPDQCSGVCVNKSTDISNCGACGTACTNNHGATQCKNGYCGPTCSIGYASCDGNNNNGCEANLLTDNKNCGTCGRVCPTGTTCIEGTCKGSAVPSCGDSVKAGTEGCDDGNTVNGDGCSSVCTVEQGYQCVGQPSVCTSI